MRLIDKELKYRAMQILNINDTATLYEIKKAYRKKAKQNKIPIIGKIPYRKDFVDSTIKMKPVVEINPEYRKIFKEIIEKIKESF